MISVTVATRTSFSRHRWFRMFVDDVRMTIWDTCMQLDDAQNQVQDDVSGPKCQMVSSIQLIKFPANPSTPDDVGTWSTVDTVKGF